MISIAQDFSPKSLIKYPAESSAKSIEYFPPNSLSSEVTLNDSIYFWVWDTINLAWSPSVKITDMEYNDEQELKLYTISLWEGGQWNKRNRHALQFDDDHKLLFELEQVWSESTGEWINVYKTSNAYDANDRLIRTTYQWNLVGEWQNISRNTFTYDASDNLLSSLLERYNFAAWENESLITYTYDSEHNILSSVLQRWEETQWINESAEFYTHDAAGNLLTTQYNIWNGQDWQGQLQYFQSFNDEDQLVLKTGQQWIDTTWVNYDQFAYTYTAENLPATEFVETWDGADWADTYFYTYAYNDNRDETHVLVERWNGLDWVRQEEKVLNYDQDYKLLWETYKYFQADGSVIMFGDSVNYYFQGTTSIDHVDNLNLSFSVFPNPTNGKFIINADVPIYSIAVFDQLGKRVYLETRTTMTNQLEVEFSAIPCGPYCVSIQTEKGISTQMVIVQ